VTTRGRLAGAVVVAIALLAPAGARAQEPKKPIASAGLRPTVGTSYGGTDIQRLPEAQRLREIVDEVVTKVTGRPILNHAALRAALGTSYLVELFDCRGDSKCVARVCRKLEQQTSLVVYGDYGVNKQTLLVRVRLLELPDGKLLAEHEFSLPVTALADRERWSHELDVLLVSIKESGTGGEGTSGGGEDGGTGGEGTSGGGEGGAGSGGEEGGAGGEPGHQTDELTDADFGVVETTDTTVRAEESRKIVRFMSVGAGLVLWSRRFDFTSAEGFEALRPEPFRSGWSAMASGSAELWPFAIRRGGLLRHLGLFGEYARSVTTGIGSSRAQADRLAAGLNYRVPIGNRDTLPTFTLSAGYLQESVEVKDGESDLPDVGYRAATVGGDMRVPIATPRFALNGGVRYLLVGAAGDLLDPDTYGRSRVGGLELAGWLELQPFGNLEIQLGGGYARFVHTFSGNGELSTSGAIGAKDRYFTGSASAQLVF